MPKPPQATVKPANVNGKVSHLLMPSVVVKPLLATPGRRETLALCIKDMDRLPQVDRDGIRHLLSPEAGWIRVNGEAYVQFAGDLLEAAAICDRFRLVDDSFGASRMRLAIRRVTAWERLPGDALLTVMVNGELLLNPAIFLPAAGPVNHAKPIPLRRHL